MKKILTLFQDYRSREIYPINRELLQEMPKLEQNKKKIKNFFHVRASKLHGPWQDLRKNSLKV